MSALATDTVPYNQHGQEDEPRPYTGGEGQIEQGRQREIGRLLHECEAPERETDFTTPRDPGSSRVDLTARLPIVAPTQPPQESFRALESWEGTVTELDEDTFWARLISKKGEEIVEFPYEEIGPDDHHLVQPGAVFYWSIGYLDGPSGRRKESIILFRRLPAWSRRELQVAEQEAEELALLFDGEPGEP